MNEPDPPRSVLTERLAAERRGHGRVLWPALSIALHLLALYFIQLRTPSAEVVAPESSRLMRIFSFEEREDNGDPGLDLALPGPISDPAMNVPPEPRPAVPATVPGPRVSTLGPGSTTGSGSTAAGGATAGSAAEGGSALGRLRYRMPMTDVWRRSDPPPVSDEEMVRARVASQLNAYNDSVAAEAAAAARATDWTVRDADGGRWGVSPGAIHLGSVTLPLPFTFSPPPGRREEIAGRLTNWTAIQQQATIVEGREIVKDRIKAIEQRKAAERAARQNRTTVTPPGGTSGGSNSSGGTTPRGGS